MTKHDDAALTKQAGDLVSRIATVEEVVIESRGRLESARNQKKLVDKELADSLEFDLDKDLWQQLEKRVLKLDKTVDKLEESLAGDDDDD